MDLLKPLVLNLFIERKKAILFSLLRFSLTAFVIRPVVQIKHSSDITLSPL